MTKALCYVLRLQKTEAKQKKKKTPSLLRRQREYS